jgi:GNAT superfamily N-acetyltransferase
MGELRLVLRQAGTEHREAVRNLLTEASDWLRGKDTDQWAEPWPDADRRAERIIKAIEARRTWIAWDEDQPAATLTASPHDHMIWPESIRHEPAVYVRRLVVGRQYAGNGLGGQLLDWAGLRARGVHWVRVDVWTTNTGLHGYYRRQGFERSGQSPVEGYPSAALFQKPTIRIRLPETPLFHVDPTTAWHPLWASSNGSPVLGHR